MGWFDTNDQLINPPSDKELLNIVSVTTSEIGSFTIMDFNTGMALFETADDPEVLRDLPRSLLIGLCLTVANDSTKKSLKHQNKTQLIEKLRNSVRRHRQAP